MTMADRMAEHVGKWTYIKLRDGSLVAGRLVAIHGDHFELEDIHERRSYARGTADDVAMVGECSDAARFQAAREEHQVALADRAGRQ